MYLFNVMRCDVPEPQQKRQGSRRQVKRAWDRAPEGSLGFYSCGNTGRKEQDPLERIHLQVTGEGARSREGVLGVGQGAEVGNGDA